MRSASPARLARPLPGLALVLLAVAAWLAWPRPSAPPPRPALHALLLDASASVTRQRPGWAAWARRTLAEEARRAQEEGAELLLVRFAADVEVLFGPGSPAQLEQQLAGRRGAPLRLRPEPASEAGTRLEAALELAARELLAPGRAPGTLVRVGEASFTGPDPRPALARLARAGVAARELAPPPPELPNLALVELELPPAPAAGEPLAARVGLELEAGEQPLAELLASTELLLELELRSSGAPRSQRIALRPPPLARGARQASWSLALDLGPAPPGWIELEARARLVGPAALRAGDPIPEDDRRSAATRAGGARTALAVAPRGRRAELETWLSGEGWPGIAWRVREPHELAFELGRADLVLTVDVPLAELPAADLARFVERDGGGWIASGGWGLLRQWTGGPDQPQLARLLPLVPAGTDEGPREVLFLVDGSGSMVGEPFERVQRALVEMAEVAPPRDTLTLRFFTGLLHAPRALSGPTPAARRRALEGLLGLRPPGGETAILYSLEQLAAQLAVTARPGRVILLSDGRDVRAFDVAERAAAIRAGLAARGIALVVVAAGQDADRGLLGELAGDPALLHDAGDLSGLAELFQLEVNRERVREGPSPVALADPGSAALLPARELLEALARLDAQELPALERHARCEAAPGAAVLLRAGPGEPVLAVQRVGAGLVAAFASGPIEGWAPAWRGARAALGALVHGLAGPPRERAPRLSVEGGRLEVRDLPPGLPGLLEARLEDPAGKPVLALALELPVGRPGEDPRGRRVSSEPLPEATPGAGPLRVILAAGGSELSSLPFAFPAAEEWLLERPLADGPFLGGSEPSSSASGALPGAPDPRHVPVLLGALGVLFLAALARLRRA